MNYSCSIICFVACNFSGGGSLDLPCDVYEPENNDYLDGNVHPTSEESDGSQVVEPADLGRIFEWLGGPDIAHGHAPEDIHYNE